MKKLFYSCLLLALWACGGKEQPLTPIEPTPEPETEVRIGSKANCILAPESGEYAIASRSATGQARLIWETRPGFVVSLSREADHWIVCTAETGANALIGEYDPNGQLLWSWHIWSPKVPVRDLPGGLMSLNLGATGEEGIDSFGLLYQWGRKDPFPGSPVSSGGTSTTLPIPVYDAQGKPLAIEASSYTDTEANTLAYSILHPTVVLSNYAQFSQSRDWLRHSDDGLWSEEKTPYDPCPEGYRVPSPEAFRSLTPSGGYSWGEEQGEALHFYDLSGAVDVSIADRNGNGRIDWEDYRDGWTFLFDGDTSYFPACSRYDGSYAMLMGSMAGLWGNYWTCRPDEEGRAYALSFSIRDMAGNVSLTLSPSSSGSRADAYSVRCIKI